MEQARQQPEQTSIDNGTDELERVQLWMQRIDDAYESGNGENVADLLLAMKKACDPNITSVGLEARRLGVLSPQTDPEQ